MPSSFDELHVEFLDRDGEWRRFTERPLPDRAAADAWLVQMAELYPGDPTGRVRFTPTVEVVVGPMASRRVVF